MNPYSAFKVLHHSDRLAMLKAGRQVPPVHLQLVLSDTCNQSCSFCAYRIPTGFSQENFGGINPKRMLPFGKAVDILRDAQELGVKAVQFTGGGEPTAHPNHPDIFRLAQDIGLETALITNGLILRDIGAYRRMSWLRVSLDAATPVTYERVHRSPTFNRVLRNLEQICGMGGDCYVGTSFVVTEDNFEEIADTALLVRELGAKYLRVTALLSTGGRDYFYEDARKKIEEARELETPGFRIIDLYEDRSRNLDEGSPDYQFCSHQQLVAYIGGDQKVDRCCHTAYTDLGEVGDLSEQSLIEWFNSPEKQRAIGEFDARACRFCTYGDKNKLINYMISPEPAHVNFI